MNSELGLQGTRAYNWPSSDPLVESEPIRGPEVIHRDNLIRRNVLVPSIILEKVEGLRTACPFDPTLCCSEDYVMWLRVTRKDPAANLPGALTSYRNYALGEPSKSASLINTRMRAIITKPVTRGVFRRRPFLRRRTGAHFRSSCSLLFWNAGEVRTTAIQLLQSLFSGLFNFHSKTGSSTGNCLRVPLSIFQRAIVSQEHHYFVPSLIKLTVYRSSPP